MAKEMTIEGLLAAKGRAVQMFDNFGREEEADEFERMSPEEYAARKGIEIVPNPTPPQGEVTPMSESRRRNPAERADAAEAEVRELRGQLERVYGIVSVTDSIDSEKGLRNALDRISDVVGYSEDDEEEYDEEEYEEEEDEED